MRRARGSKVGTSDSLEPNTIVVDSREAIWRVRVYPGHVQLFLSRAMAEARARDIARLKAPPWTVILHEPNA